jgi:hypothetical protein
MINMLFILYFRHISGWVRGEWVLRTTEETIGVWPSWENIWNPFSLFPLNTTYTEQVGVAVTVQTYIREVLYSNLGRDTDYPDWGFFSSVLPVKFHNSTSIRPRSLSDSFFINHCTIRRYILMIYWRRREGSHKEHHLTDVSPVGVNTAGA